MLSPRVVVLFCVAILAPAAFGQGEIGASRVTPNLVSNIDRPLRYHPDHGDFVIENGTEYFNRTLYGGNTAFRVDGGDKPEFVLYLPGRGGNLRLGLRAGGTARWLSDAGSVETRYRPGELLYAMRDPAWGSDATLSIEALAYAETEGLILRVTGRHLPAGAELFWAYGGVNGQRGKRDGDIGTESVPISQWFQLKPEFCRGNDVQLADGGFEVRAKPARIAAVVPAGAVQWIADAARWNDAAALFNSGPTESGQRENSSQPIVAGRVSIASDAAVYLSLQRLPTTAAVVTADLDTYREVTAPGAAADTPKPAPLPPLFSRAELPARFALAERHFAELRGRVRVDTPDEFINAAVGALNVAGDAVWDDPQQVIMHGAIAWRTKLLGWRGPYLLDALGWHDRARRNISYWIGRQNTAAITPGVPPPDEKANLARNEAGLHSNGDLSNSHYDMNLVFIDGVFRHLQWTGDVAFAKQMWPVIERHLAWERRLFRREFGPDKLPLYEAYAAIWASDDLQYSGGGAMHASAYNYYENRQAARLARLIGADPTPYDREAELLARGMRQLLWVTPSGPAVTPLESGWFAESKDWLGAQRVHPDAALWTFYHTVDSEVPTAKEAWQFADYVQQTIPHLPVRGLDVPAGLETLATSNWMPYDWSINNVVLPEAVHGALAFWEAGRSNEAFAIAKGSLVAAMFMGISPGNVGSMSYLDVYRRESQRDFADGAGVLSRALIEGLFGVKPDALAREVRVTPGWPAEWMHAAIEHPDFELRFERRERTDRYELNQHWHGGAGGAPDPAAMTMRLRLLARRDRVAAVTIDGRPADWRVLENSVGSPRVEIVVPPQARQTVAITWAGDEIAADRRSASGRFEVARQGEFQWVVPPAVPPSALSSLVSAAPTGLDYEATTFADAAFEPVDLTDVFNDSVTQIFRNEYRTPRSPYVSLALPKQGLGGWAGGMNRSANIDDAGLRAVALKDGGRIRLPNGVPFATPGEPNTRNVVFTSQWDNYPRAATIPLRGSARGVYVLVAGSTNPMQSRIDNGELAVEYADGTRERLLLTNPTNWWPIEQDYLIDDFQFRRPGPLPMRVDLKTGAVRVPDRGGVVGRGSNISGGAATVLALRLDASKPLRSLSLRATANDVVVGLLAATLVR